MGKNSANYIISEAPINKTMIYLIIPAILGSIVGQVNFIIDTYFISQVTYANIDILLAGIAAAFPIFLLIMAFATLFAIGGSIYATSILGSGDKLRARSVFSGTVVSGLILDIILIFLGFLLLTPMLKVLGANTPEILAAGKEYSFWMILGSPTIILTFIFVMFARSEGKSTLVLISIFIQTVLNIILNYWFIIPLEMGVGGASLATVISQFSQFLIVGVFLFSSRSEFRFNFKYRKYFNTNDLKELMFIGFPATLGMALLTITAGILQFQAGQYNDVELIAAIGILIKFLTIFTMLVQAAASGIQPVFSYSYGAKNLQRFDQAYSSYLVYSTIISIVLGASLFVYEDVFANMLNLTGNIANYIELGTKGLGIMLIFMPASFLLQVVFQSLGDAKTSMYIVFIRQLLLFIVVTIILNNLYGINGLLVSQQMGVVIGSIITIIIYYSKFEKLKQKTFA